MTEQWLSNTLLPAVLVAVVFLLVLWPTRHSGVRVLKNWGVGSPTEEQAREAVRYLRHRRILYVVLIIVLPPAAGLVLPDGDNAPANLFIPLLVAMLVAELVATLRPVSGVRVASLDPRTWRDLLPRWATAVAAGLTVFAVAMAGLGLAAQPWAQRYVDALPPNDDDLFIDPGYRAEMAGRGVSWLTLGSVALCLAVVATLVHLAVRRPSSADGVVDAALRTRTARVAVAIGFGWLGALVNDAQQRLSFLGNMGQGLPATPPRPGWLTQNLVDVTSIVALVTLVLAIVCWMWLAMPSRRSLAHAR